MDVNTAAIFIQNFIDEHNIKLRGEDSEVIFSKIYDCALIVDNDLVINCLKLLLHYQLLDEYFRPFEPSKPRDSHRYRRRKNKRKHRY